MNSLDDRLRTAFERLRAGDSAGVERECVEVLKAAPGQADALHLLGMARLTSGRIDEAVELIGQARAGRPQDVAMLENLGLAYLMKGAHAEAERTLREALHAGSVQGLTQARLGQALVAQGRLHEAIAAFEQALALDPALAAAHYLRANALRDLRRLEEALAAYDRAVTLQSGYAEALNNRGNVLQLLGRVADAAASYEGAVRANPRFAGAWDNLGNTLRALGRREEALASYERAISARPQFAKPHYNRANVCQELGRYEEAVAGYERALALDPRHRRALGALYYARRHLCDWKEFAARTAALVAAVNDDNAVIEPLVFACAHDDAAAQLQCARQYAKNEFASVDPLPPIAPRPPAARIRIAYVSADFRQHPVGQLMAGVLEQHDRAKFEIFGFSYGADDASPLRTRLRAGCDHFLDVCGEGDRAVAQRLREQAIDIAVDLTGYTQDGRPGIFAHRAAPVQVGYLGFPGTLGSERMDYLLADEFVVPPALRAHYAEQIVYLPDCFMVNGPRDAKEAAMPTRASEGLPAEGFVFCCFNNAFKIEPRLFDVWMRLLGAVPGSVLWLRQTNAAAERNLRATAGAQGIDPARLIFAPMRARMADHLARHRLADLFLDTLPYNAHTTAADALWMGLLVVTCAGNAFAGRVAGSLLHTLGLDELITGDFAGYEALALRIASDPPYATELRAKLLRSLETTPLYDVPRFCSHLEAAYATMIGRWQSGEAPCGFSVPDTAR